MTIEEMRKRLLAITAELEQYENLKNYEAKDLDKINELHAEFESLKNNIEAKEKIESMVKETNVSARKTSPIAQPRIEVKGELESTMGFKNFGDFAKAVADKAKGRLDKRFDNSAAYEKFSEDGGVLIPTEFMTDIQKKVRGDESLMARTSKFTISGNHLSLPVDESAPWSGGIQCYWVEEGGSHTESKPALKLASWKLHKLAALVKATDELLEDAPALESYINMMAPSAITHKINDVIINGDGVAKPKGILNSGFTKTVSKEAGQTADTVVYKNIIKMEAAHIVSPSSIWIAHPQLKEQLRQLKDDNGNAIYMNGGAFPNLAAAGFDILLGKPIMYMMSGSKAVGDKGDLILADLNYYYSVMKVGGVKQAMSTHLLFDKDQTAFKFIFRVDGQCPFNSPVTTQYGSYQMSGFVALEDR